MEASERDTKSPHGPPTDAAGCCAGAALGADDMDEVPETENGDEEDGGAAESGLQRVGRDSRPLLMAR